MHTVILIYESESYLLDPERNQYMKREWNFVDGDFI